MFLLTQFVYPAAGNEESAKEGQDVHAHLQQLVSKPAPPRQPDVRFKGLPPLAPANILPSAGVGSPPAGLAQQIDGSLIYYLS